MRRVACIVLAAGSSSRMGEVDKLWADLDGAPVLAYSLRMCAALASAVDDVEAVVVAPAARHAAILALAGPDLRVRCVEGGARRRDSVAAGIAVATDAGWYLVHDAARPLASDTLAMRVLDAARIHGAAAPALPVVDTIKRVDGDERVVETVRRLDLRAVQTPQAFRGDLLREAHAASDEDATDDAELVERLGAPVQVVPGEASNLKITRPPDLAVARALLRESVAGGGRGG